jgi:phosphocarrier protein HPr
MSAKTAIEAKVSKLITIVNKLGIHARPAALFAKTANQFKSDVFVEKDGETINAKSIMGLMMLAAGPGSKILVIAQGPDADDAVKAIEKLIVAKFNED